MFSKNASPINGKIILGCLLLWLYHKFGREKQQYGPLFWLGQPFPIQKWSIRCNAIIQNKDLVNGIGYLLNTPKERLLNVGGKGKKYV